MIRIHVSGTPRPQPRPRFVRGRVVSTGSHLTKLWRVIMMAAFIKHRPKTGPLAVPVRVDCLAMFPIKDEKRWGKPHTSRPDSDNVAKAIYDCLVKAGVLKDDSLVFDGSFKKIWAERGALDVQIGMADAQRAAV